jgi:hypothetical protein
LRWLLLLLRWWRIVVHSVWHMAVGNLVGEREVQASLLLAALRHHRKVTRISTCLQHLQVAAQPQQRGGVGV